MDSGERWVPLTEQFTRLADARVDRTGQDGFLDGRGTSPALGFAYWRAVVKRVDNSDNLF